MRQADRTAMRQHHLPSETEADTGALRLGRKKGEEHVPLQGFGNAWSVVRHFDLGASTLAAAEGEPDLRPARVTNGRFDVTYRAARCSAPAVRGVAEGAEEERHVVV